MIDEIAHSVLDFWFGGDLKTNYKTKWFPTGSIDIQKNADEIVSERFSNLLDEALRHGLDSWKKHPKSTVALIIVLDQFSRHIYRQLPPDASKRQDADNLALKIAEDLIDSGSWDEELNVEEFVFSLMPFRHSATVDRLNMVMSLIDRRLTTRAEEDDLLQKFMKQTTRRLQHLQDRVKVCSTELSYDIYS